jgi:hypothetical protein
MGRRACPSGWFAYLRHDHSTKRDGGSQKKIPRSGQATSLSYADLAQFLIAHGHSWNELQDLTLGQMKVFAISALRVEHTALAKQLQGVFVAHHGNADNLQKFTEALEVKNPSEEKSEDDFAKDRARLKADMQSGFAS